MLKRVRFFLPKKELTTLYNSIILPLFDYADVICGDKSNKGLMEDLQILQNKAGKVTLRMPMGYSATEALNNLKWSKLHVRRQQHRRIDVYKCMHNLLETEIELIPNSKIHSHSRGNSNLHLPCVKTEWGKQCFAFHAAKDCNDLNNQIKNSKDLKTFKKQLFS